MHVLSRPLRQQTQQSKLTRTTCFSLRRPSTISRPILVASSPSFEPLVAHEVPANRHGSFSSLVRSILPFTSFASSIYSTPVLLILRLFYNATAVDLSLPSVRHVRNSTTEDDHQLVGRPVSAESKTDHSVARTFMETTKTTSLSILDDRDQMSTTAFLELATPLISHRIHSITWVKALSSPLSHEFIQCIVEDTTARTRHRIVVERHEDGDWVHLGLPWKADKDPHYRLGTPLPLLSLTFEDECNRPALPLFARLVADVTTTSPKYNAMKEMCWWFAEVVFEKALVQFGGRVRQWDFASLRYSLVVRTRVIRRNNLTQHAIRFRSQIATDLEY